MARLVSVCAAGLIAVGLAGCAGSTSTPSSAPPSAQATSAAASGSGTGTRTSTGPKVSANTASEDEIAAALEKAGVSSPERWAEEVVEYRPYPADDPDLTKLRENLAKYNPGQETTDKIVSALAP